MLANAVKHSPDGVSVEVHAFREGSKAVVVVLDQGMGIPSDKIAHIFDRFYQAHSTERYGYGGMGLGLYILREIVARHGERVWAESWESEGSSFYFSLPLRT